MMNGKRFAPEGFGQSLAVLMFGFGLALSAGCSSDNNDPPSDDQPIIAPDVSDDIDPDLPTESDNSMADMSDPDGDDRPGLVVEGLGGQRAEELVSPWLVNTSLFRFDSAMPSRGGARVSLLQYPDDFPVSEFVDFFASELDTCEFRREDTSTGEDDGGSPPPSISGGSTVTVNAPSGPWVVLSQQTRDDGEGVAYERPFGEWPGELPQGATLSIPGDAFPTVAAYPLSEPLPPIRLLPGPDDTLTANTSYSWIPGNGTDFIDIVFIARDPEDGEFIDFPIICSVVDDGSFEMPDDVRVFVETTTDVLDFRYERVRKIVELANGIVLFTATTVSE